MSRINWQQTIDQIILTGSSGDDRVLGLTSLRRESGVSLICRNIARTLAANRLPVLLIDLSNADSSASHDINNSPNLDSVGEYNVARGQGYDVLTTASAGETGHAHVPDLPELQELLRSKFVDYARIVIDLPPVLYESASSVNSVAAGAICDRLLLVTRVGRDKRAELAEVLSLFRDAGIRPSGLLAN